MSSTITTGARWVALACATAMLLAACGDGEGGGDAGTSDDPNSVVYAADQSPETSTP